MLLDYDLLLATSCHCCRVTSIDKINKAPLPVLIFSSSTFRWMQEADDIELEGSSVRTIGQGVYEFTYIIGPFFFIFIVTMCI